MNIRSAAEFIAPLLKTAEKAEKNCTSINFSKIAIDEVFKEIDKLTHTGKKIATVCFAVFSSLFIAGASIVVALEVAARSLKEIKARLEFDDVSHRVAACFSAVMLAPGIAISYAAFSFASILAESIKRFKEPAPLPQVAKEAPAL